MLLASLSILLPLFYLAPPVQAVDVDPPIDGTVLVVAPHPDDDVIMAAGITYDRPNTVIAYMTHGDSHTEGGSIPPGIAETRQAEAVTAQSYLGRAESDMRFLGYPDYHLETAWNTYSPAVVTGATGMTETYASRGLGGTDWHDYRTGSIGEHGAYNHEAMLADMVALIEDVRPDHVFTTNPEDGTADHRTTYAVVKAAMEQVNRQRPHVHREAPFVGRVAGPTGGAAQRAVAGAILRLRSTDAPHSPGGRRDESGTSASAVSSPRSGTIVRSSTSRPPS